MSNPARLLLPLAIALPSAAQEPASLIEAVREVQAVRGADSVVVARVVAVHDSPGAWCGTVVTRQEVTYRIERVVDGTELEGEVRIGHLLVANSPLVDSHAPFLRPDLLWTGARAVLCVNRGTDGLVVLDETYGARVVEPPRAADPIRAALVGAVLRLPALRPYVHLEQVDRRPLRCALNAEVPLPFDAEVDGCEVRFEPSALLRGDPHVEVTHLVVDGDAARVEFALRAEGVVGHAAFARRDGAWAVADARVFEHQVVQDPSEDPAAGR